MIAPKLILSGFGLAAFAGVAYQFIDLGQTSTSSTNKKFLVANISGINETNIPDSGIIDNKGPNYLFEVNDKKINNCAIYKLNTSGKNVLLSEKADITNNLTVVISCSENEYSTIKEQSTVSIHSKDKASKYFDLTISNSEFNKDRGIKANLVIAKVKDVNDTIPDSINKTAYKLDITSDKDCKIYKVSGSVNLSNTTIPFASNSLTVEKEVNKKSDISKAEYVIIETKEQNIFTEDWNNSKKEIFLNDGTTKFLTLENITPILGATSEISGMLNVQENQNAYLIVSPEVVSPASNGIVTSNFYKDNTKGYKCEVPIISNQTELDDSCELYNFNTPNNTNSVDLHNIATSATNAIVTSVPATSQKFVLKISRNLLSRMQTTGTPKIALVDKDDTTKKYINLSKEYLLNRDFEGFKTNIILAKISNQASSTPTLTSTTVDFKCKTKPGSEVIGCKVLRFSTDPTDTNGSISINNQHLDKLSNTENSRHGNGKYVLIQLDENLKTEKELRSFAPEIYLENNQSSYLFKTEYVDSYVGTFDKDTPASSKLFKVQKSPQDYLVVVHSVASTNVADAELIADGVKNYQCKLSSPEITDVSCSLISITETAGKGINLNTVSLANETLKIKTNFASNKYFKLIINDAKFMSQEFDNSKTITIESNKNNDTKTYGEVKVVSKFIHGSNEGKTSWFLAKASADTANLNNSDSFKCKFTDDQNKTDCTIFGKSSVVSESADKTWDLSSFTKETTSANNLGQNKYAIIKLSSEKPISNFSGKTIKVTKGSETNEVNFNVETPLHVISDTSVNTITGKPLILTQ